MSDYPYLAALLPLLNFGDTEFPSSERFLAEAEKWLDEEEYAILSSASVDDYTAQEHPLELVAEYSRFEYLMRRDVVAFIEARRLGHDHTTTMFPTSHLKDATPLEAERRLLKVRWDYVSTQLTTHHEDLHAFVVYRIKLQILERLASFDRETGAERFERLADIDLIPREVSADQ
ncbi:MAG: DUF2764 family protein [Lentisphaeria bacterium]|nr:DUF2764 family protein [Lentisphaeria bacterium]